MSVEKMDTNVLGSGRRGFKIGQGPRRGWLEEVDSHVQSKKTVTHITTEQKVR